MVLTFKEPILHTGLKDLYFWNCKKREPETFKYTMWRYCEIRDNRKTYFGMYDGKPKKK
jgi:hypothetical protein